MNVSDYAGLTDVGQVRDHNEDCILVTEHVLAVADGVGGASFGEVASQCAIDVIRDDIATQLTAGEVPTAQLARELVERGVQAANSAVLEAQTQSSERIGMATTLTCVVFAGEVAVLGHVGDSRAYRVRDGVATQVTNDHSMVAEMERRGELSAEEARTHPRRNVITRALGADAHVEVDIVEAPLLAGDWIVLCSDGLSGMVDDAHIGTAFAPNAAAASACQSLIDQANAAGGTDNISVVAARVAGELGDLALDPNALAAPESAPAPRSPAEPDKRSRWRRLAAPLIALLVVICIVIVGLAIWDHSYFLVTRHDGRIGADHGFPVAGMHTDYRTIEVRADAISQTDHDQYLARATLRNRHDVDTILNQFVQESQYQ